LNTVFMFPGQGSQQVGMGRDLSESIPEIADLYARANEIVGYDLASTCFEGPAERLNITEISQPAIFVTSVACLTALRMGKVATGLTEIEPEACAGLSLGEYTALYAAGAVEFDDALKLVQLRARSMQTAAEQRKGTMVSILGLGQEEVARLCQAVLDDPPTEDDGLTPLLVPVNFNCPGQIVISGSPGACNRAAVLAEKFGLAKAVPLQVAGAFHTEMMAPAASQLRGALNACPFSPPSCKLIANVDGQFYDSTEQITEKLLRQLTSAVRWQQSIEFLLDQGAQRFVEIGPGRVLTGLLKKICRARKQKVQQLNISGLTVT